MKALINYVCPKCLTTFMASQVEQAIADESVKSETAETTAVEST